MSYESGEVFKIWTLFCSEIKCWSSILLITLTLLTSVLKMILCIISLSYYTVKSWVPQDDIDAVWTSF